MIENDKTVVLCGGVMWRGGESREEEGPPTGR